MLSRRRFVLTGLSALLATEQVRAMSYFSPGLGTVGNTNAIGSPSLAGEARSMVVTCADPKTVWGIVDGVPTWHTVETGHVRAAQLFEGLVFYVAGTKVKAVHPKTGYVWREWDFGRMLTGVWVGQLSNGTTMGVCYASPGQNPQPLANAVELFQISPTGGIQSIHLVAEPTNNARALYVESGRVIIADTFGHRVLVTKISTGLMETYTGVWYPNDVRPLPDWRILVTAEHENRLFKWDRDTNQRELVISAPISPFNDITQTRAQIEVATANSAAIAPYSPVYTPPKQNAAQEYHSAISPYAPNAAYMVGDDLVIADTDNDRVIIVRDGQIVTEVTGLNNPVGVALF